mmetsp:Transcript_32000/g.77855  ORF Transcript_32000/g.77855 Transcript_32000/m.77855 type:complete len:427 (+) Transcript_32000:96-1376(+)
MARGFMVASTSRTSLLTLVVAILYCLILYKTNTYSVECFAWSSFSNNEAVIRSSSISRSSTYRPSRQQISMLKSNIRQGLPQDRPTASSSYSSFSSRTTQWMSPADNDSSSDTNKELAGDRTTDKALTTATTLKEEAEKLKQQADQLRKEINASSSSSSSTHTKTDTNTNTSPTATTKSSSSSSPWDIVRSFSSSSSSFVEGGDEDDPIEEEEYRLCVDIGREDGTWMDPRWGASGKRIEFTIDVRLLPDRSLVVVSGGSSSDMDSKDPDDNNEALTDPQLVLEKFENAMVKDNTMGKSSEVYPLETAQYARLRNGFDRMECSGGAYRIDQSPRDGGRYTLRLVLEVEGTTKADQQYMYGDVSVPPGYLYFSLPCFGGSISQLSSKEGPVTVRQVGWHTGWRRQESRIVGVFRAKPLADAKRIDKY